MKKFILILTSVLLMCLQGVQAQWLGTTNATDPIQRSGNVGIGTTTLPTVKLEVNNGNTTLPSFLKVDPLASNVQLSLLSTSTNSNATMFDIRNKRGTGATTNGGFSGLNLSYDATAILPDTGPNHSSFLLKNDDINLAYLQFTNQNSNYSIYNLSKLIEIDANTGNKICTNKSINDPSHPFSLGVRRFRKNEN